MSDLREPRLVLRFAVASLVAFALVGSAGLFSMTRYARARAERVGAERALFVGSSILSPAVAGLDLGSPVTGAAYRSLEAIVRTRVLADGHTVRVKIWRPDGTIVFSDDPKLVGATFPEESGELRGIAAGHVESGVSDLQDAENARERNLADKLFFTYMPLRTEPGGPVVAVAELYQDYAFIQTDIDAIVRRLALVLGIGLPMLYLALLPIALRASRELRRRNQRLNELLAHEQETVAELRDLNRKKEDFVAAASHELRTPLTSIIGYLSTLRRPELGEDAAVRAEFLDAAEGQTKRLLRLITNLLSAAHLEEGTRPVVVELVDLAALTRAIVAELPGALARVDVDIPADAPVATDRGRIADVLHNLLDNALKYSPADTRVEVGATIEDTRFRVWVTDSGIGISPEDVDAIFDRFHQVDQTATRRYGGVGLGLHLSKGLVEELAGAIEVASSPGRGSTFTVVLPMSAMSSALRAEPVRS